MSARDRVDRASRQAVGKLGEQLPLGGLSLLSETMRTEWDDPYCASGQRRPQRVAAVQRELIRAALEAGRPVFYLDCNATNGLTDDLTQVREQFDTPLLAVSDHLHRWIGLDAQPPASLPVDRLWLAKSTASIIDDDLRRHEQDHGPALVVLGWVERFRPPAGRIVSWANPTDEVCSTWHAGSSNVELQRQRAEAVAAFARSRPNAATLAVSREASQVCRDAIRRQAGLVMTIGRAREHGTSITSTAYLDVPGPVTSSTKVWLR